MNLLIHGMDGTRKKENYWSRKIGHFGAKKVIRLVTWNVAGIRKIKEAWEFLREYGIIMVQETWLEKDKEKEVKGWLDKDYLWYFKAAAKAQGKKKGRAKGGVVVGMRKNLAKGITIEEWEHGLWI